MEFQSFSTLAALVALLMGVNARAHADVPDPLADYDKLKRQLRAISERRLVECDARPPGNEEWPFRCIASRAEAAGLQVRVLAPSVFVPPFPADNAFFGLKGRGPTPTCNSYFDGPRYYFTTSWAPIDEVFDGGRQFSRLVRLARRGKAFSCDEESCLRPVVTMVGGDRILAECTSSLVNGQLGAPGGCAPIAITREGRTWMRVVSKVDIEFEQVSCTQAMEVAANVETVPGAFGIAELMEALERRLRAGGLSLQTKFVPSTTRTFLRATSGKRASPVLAQGFDEVDLSVHVWEDASRPVTDASYSSVALSSWEGGKPIARSSQAKPARLSLVIYFHLWVSRQNAADHLSWHEARPQEAALYVERFRTEIEAATQDACRATGKTLRTGDGQSWACE